MKSISTKGLSVLLILIFIIMTASCSSKFSQQGKLKPMSNGNQVVPASDAINIEFDEDVETQTTYPPDAVRVEIEDPAVKVEPETTQTENSGNEGHWAIPDLSALKQLVLPCFSKDSELYIGEDSASIFDQFIFQSSLLDEPIPVDHWEALVRAAFYLKNNEESNQFIKMYLTDFSNEGFITRQAAVAGMMKLASLRFPIVMGGSGDDLKSADTLLDMDQCEDRFDIIIRLAYCQGFTDQTVEASLNFRPLDFFTYGEAVSTVYRVISKYGLYMPVLDSSPDPNIAAGNQSSEWMKNECEDYYRKLQSDNRDSAANKINILKTAENIIYPGSTEESWNLPMEIERWQGVLRDAFGLDGNEVLAYTALGQDDGLSWDIAAISIFKLGFKINAFDIRDAAESEIESARVAINNLDTAMDISKFAQMYSTGLLRGISGNSGFNPKSQVTRGEALLLAKRIVEHMPDELKPLEMETAPPIDSFKGMRSEIVP